MQIGDDCAALVDLVLPVVEPAEGGLEKNQDEQNDANNGVISDAVFINLPHSQLCRNVKHLLISSFSQTQQQRHTKQE